MANGLNIHDVDVLIRKIKDMGGPNAQQVIVDTINDAMNDDVYPIWLKNISLDDHTLEDLRRLGHPYAKRLGIDSGPHPDYMVHEQGGGLIAGSTIQECTPGDLRATITETAPEYVYLRYGTSTMRMRDPAGDALAEALPLIKQRFADRFVFKYLEIIGK
jgi:hypothetical protein